MRWMPEYEWQWLRAQCYQESLLQPRAVSHAGAKGLCQFLPGTWSDASRAIGVRNVYDPAENAWAAGWYMRRQLNRWIWDRTDIERLELAQAGYNAGRGNILAAQRKCGSPKTWDEIKQCLPDITGRHSAETIGYVERIKRWYGAMTCGKQR
jgi:membrane-bound lytic murein transglycosylase F